MTLRRHLLGVFGLLLLLAAGVLWWNGSSDSNLEFARSVCMRAGLVLCALWLALPQLVAFFSRVPAWVIIGAVVAALLLVISPKALLYLLPVAAAMLVLQFVGWLFKPLPKRKSRKKQPDRES